jgi:hypothetical protein
LTDVFPSSSDALLPPPILLVMLMRLLLLGGFITALIGLCGKPDGDPGGELAMAQLRFLVATKRVALAGIAYMVRKKLYFKMLSVGCHYFDDGMCRWSKGCRIKRERWPKQSKPPIHVIMNKDFRDSDKRIIA